MAHYEEAAGLIRKAKFAVAFTGAGISVESGIPTFRGENGLWSRYDPKILDIDYFTAHPEESWRTIREIFYDYMGAQAKPNRAHRFITKLEKEGVLKGVIMRGVLIALYPAKIILDLSTILFENVSLGASVFHHILGGLPNICLLLLSQVQRTQNECTNGVQFQLPLLWTD